MKSALIDHFNLPLVYTNDVGQKVTLAEAAPVHMWQIEGIGDVAQTNSAVAALTQQTVPQPNQFTQTQHHRLVWQGLNRYVLLNLDAKTDNGTKLADGNGLYVTEQTGSKTQINISGELAHALLMRGVQVDISDTSMPVGSAYMSHINHIGVTIMRLPEVEGQPMFELWVMRGFAVSLFEFLKHTAATLQA